MKESFLLTIALAFLRVVESSGRQETHVLQKVAVRRIGEGAELLCVIAILSLIYFLVLGSWIPPGLNLEIAGLFFLPAAYAAVRIRKKSISFFLAAYVLPVFFIHRGPDLFPFAGILLPLGAAAGMMVFEILFLSLKERLIYSPVPRPFAGLPAVFWLAASLSLILSGWLPAVSVP